MVEDLTAETSLYPRISKCKAGLPGGAPNCDGKPKNNTLVIKRNNLTENSLNVCGFIKEKQYFV